ncbi:MAG: helix-turn-helix domain-containing protein [Sneathiellaceae bacterium]
MAVLRVGIASYEEMKARTLAIARGDVKAGPRDPTIWFTSMESFAKLLSLRNRELLETIARERPASLTALAALSGRAKSNLSRTLHGMAQYGLVELAAGPRGSLVPRVRYDRIQLEMKLPAPSQGT